MAVDGAMEPGDGRDGSLGSHWITEDETRSLAEMFVASSPYIGDVAWSQVPIGPGAPYLRDFSGDLPKDLNPGDPLPDGTRWSWELFFTDPSGREFRLRHDSVVAGITRVAYEGDGRADSLQELRLIRIRQWYTEPSDARRRLRLKPEDAVTVCQLALWDKVAFPYEDENAVYGRMDSFEDQR